MNSSLDELQWKSPEWIQAFGLRTENVMDYFSESPFFDKTSNNHVIKMQRQFSQPTDNMNGNAANQLNPQVLQSQGFQQDQNEFSNLDPMRRDVLIKYPLYASFERELSKLRGVEYVLASVREPDYWIIKKQNRVARDKTQTLQHYYIIGANVYQAPSVFNVVQSRLMSTNYHLSETIKNLHKLTQFQPSQGVQFKNTSSLQYGSGTTAATGSSVASVPATATTNGALSTVATVATTAQTGSTAQFENTRGREMITKEMMDKLMVTSIKSKPEYIQ